MDDEDYENEYEREWQEAGCPECGRISCQGCDGKFKEFLYTPPTTYAKLKRDTRRICSKCGSKRYVHKMELVDVHHKYLAWCCFDCN